MARVQFPTQFSHDERRRNKCRLFNELLEEIGVLDPGMWTNDTGPKDWFAVITEKDGIVAYFFKEVDAYRFRLDLINRRLNP